MKRGFLDNADGTTSVLKVGAIAISIGILYSLFAGANKDDGHQRFLLKQKAMNVDIVKQDNHRQAIAQQLVLIGMSEEECRAAWGGPSQINPTTLPNNSVHEQWCYINGSSDTRYLYFENGVLTSIQGYPRFFRVQHPAAEMPETTAAEELRRRDEVLRKAGLNPNP